MPVALVSADRPSQGARLRAWSDQVTRTTATKRLVLTAFLVLIYRQTFAGPIRAYLPGLWYVPDYLLGIGFVFLVISGIRERIIQVMIVTAFFALYVLLSLLSNEIEAVALSARQVLYFVLAIFAGGAVRSRDRTTRHLLILSSLIAIGGVYYDSWYGVPWGNALFTGLLRTAEVSRVWWGHGIRRLSGLGISSGDTSVLIAAGFLIVCSGTDRLSKLAAIVLAGPTVYALILTAQKATASWLVIIAGIAYVVPTVLMTRRPFAAAPTLRLICLAALVLCVLAPTLFWNVDLGSLVGADAPTLAMRTTGAWPNVVSTLISGPRILVGYGFGSAADTSTIDAFAYVDNAFLYTAVTIGVPAAIAMFVLAFAAILKTSMRDGMDYCGLALLALLISNGITANVIAAGGVGSLYLGFAYGLLKRTPGPDKRRMVSRRPAPAQGFTVKLSSATGN